MSCLYIGTAMSSISLVLAEGIGWRLTYVVVGVVGILITLAVAPFIRSQSTLTPEQMGYKQIAASEEESEETYTLSGDLKELVKNNTLVLITLIGFFRFSGLYARAFFEPEFFTKAYPDHKGTYSTCNAVSVMLTCLGPIIGGYYTDVHEASNPKLRPLVCCVTTLVVLPLFFVMYLVDNFYLALVCNFLAYAFGEMFISINSAMLVNVCTPRVVAMQNALFVGAAFIGGSISTFTLGWVDHSLDDLKYALLVVMIIAYGVTGVLYFALIKIYPDDLKNNSHEVIEPKL
mmetsp:Transcript_10163/g.19919  ORF Transcript_10163/g.19919 Transcript_10163/m.19919 type:complete len:289 (-) Transcript_10163:64-930(-)